MRGAGWQQSRVGLVVAGLALLAAVPGILAAAGVRNPAALATSAGVAAVVVALAGVWQERYRRMAERGEALELEVAGGCLVLSSGRLPQVRDVTDPVQLGVHPSAPAKSVTGDGLERVPPYIPRDIDVELRERLASGGFVLLVGESAAGKSRAAFEAMSSTLADHVLVAPSGQDGLVAAVDKAAQMPRCVLWLNDLERFAGESGLTRTQVTRLLPGQRQHRVILATLRAVEEERLTTVSAGNETMGREAREMLEQADRIRLDRRFSRTELAAARTQDWDARIADALAHAGEYGIAEYLAAGPELLRDFENAWDVGAHPRGAALVAAAIDCRRAGYQSPLPRPLLEQLHQMYLEERGGDRLRPEPFHEAWQWATLLRRSTTALLQPTGDVGTVTVFDYLVDVAQRRAGSAGRVAEKVVITALAYAPLADVVGLAYKAHNEGSYTIAADAWAKAVAEDRANRGDDDMRTMANWYNLAVALRASGRLEEAEREHSALMEVWRLSYGGGTPIIDRRWDES